MIGVGTWSEVPRRRVRGAMKMRLGRFRSPIWMGSKRLGLFVITHWMTKIRRVILHLPSFGAAVFLQRKVFEPVAEGRPEVVPFEGELDGGVEEALLVAGVVALAFVVEAVDLFVLEQSFDAVSELEFAAGTWRNGLEHFEDAWSEDVTADDRVLRRCVFELRFFDHAPDVEEARIPWVGCAVENAIGGDGGPLDGLGGEDG